MHFTCTYDDSARTGRALLGPPLRTARALEEVGTRTRNSLPIVSSVAMPTVMLAPGGMVRLGVDGTALATALAVTIARMALFGWVIERLRGERSTAGNFLTGIGLAVVSTLVAGLKFARTR